jgi:hypothetical protein
MMNCYCAPVNFDAFILIRFSPSRENGAEILSPEQSDFR